MLTSNRRAPLNPIKSLVKNGKGEEKAESVLRNQMMELNKCTSGRRISRGEKKLCLQQDVDRLKKRLIYEENVHRALERAFSRPLGSRPRLPPYLPLHTVELLAEVAVLEEEVVRLEEQVVLFKRDLYQEVAHISTSKRSTKSLSLMQVKRKEPENIGSAEGSSVMSAGAGDVEGTGMGKENRSLTELAKNKKQLTKDQQIQTPVRQPSPEKRQVQKNIDPKEPQLECRSSKLDTRVISNIPQDKRKLGDHSPNSLSENILKCLMTILLRMGRTSKSTVDQLPFLATYYGSEDTQFQDPYAVCSDTRRDIGPYKNLCSFEHSSLNLKRKSTCLFLLGRMKILLEKLASVHLQGLTHQQKLAFWINVYNSCMMNGFIEHGVPENPETVTALMQKATLNVGGHLLNAMKIEHFFLRLPYCSKYNLSKVAKNNELTAQSVHGLELSEPLVTFAISCGSWSSPAVRVYTASQVENELEVAKRDYLQAAVGISKTGDIVIPKLLEWHLLDFAKDLESFLDWICLQLPTEQRKEAIRCLERSKNKPLSQCVQITPYEFRFRYLLATSTELVKQ